MLHFMFNLKLDDISDAVVKIVRGGGSDFIIARLGSGSVLREMWIYL